jgi:predicted RNA-binding Zn ribbon-like protein
VPTTDFRFVSGRLCLDLVATLGKRGIADLERLRTPADLARWAVAAGVCPIPPTATDADLTAARTLRESIHRLVTPLVAPPATPLFTPPATADLHTVNHWAAHQPAPTLTWSPAGFQTASPFADARDVLAAAAIDTISLVSGPEAGRIRTCQASDCTLLFVDQSQNGRAWCAMNVCGARAKMRSLRERRRNQ